MPKYEDMGSPYEVALNDVRALVQPDGADFRAVEFDDATGTLTLDLVLEGSNCAECVMPVDMLELIALDILGPKVSGLRAVKVNDPRANDPDFAAH